LLQTLAIEPFRALSTRDASVEYAKLVLDTFFGDASIEWLARRLNEANIGDDDKDAFNQLSLSKKRRNDTSKFK